MATGTARTGGSTGEGLQHFGAVRMRVVGQGMLKMKLDSLDDIKEQELVPFTLNSATNKEPTRLCNFIEQRAALTVYTITINDYFRINRMIVFAKDMWSSYPGTE